MHVQNFSVQQSQVQQKQDDNSWPPKLTHLRLSVHQHVKAEGLLHSNGKCHLLVNQALIVNTAQGTVAQQGAQAANLWSEGQDTQQHACMCLSDVALVLVNRRPICSRMRRRSTQGVKVG